MTVACGIAREHLPRSRNQVSVDKVPDSDPSRAWEASKRTSFSHHAKRTDHMLHFPGTCLCARAMGTAHRLPPWAGYGHPRSLIPWSATGSRGTYTYICEGHMMSDMLAGDSGP